MDKGDKRSLVFIGIVVGAMTLGGTVQGVWHEWWMQWFLVPIGILALGYWVYENLNSQVDKKRAGIISACLTVFIAVFVVILYSALTPKPTNTETAAQQKQETPKSLSPIGIRLSDESTNLLGVVLGPSVRHIKLDMLRERKALLTDRLWLYMVGTNLMIDCMIVSRHDFGCNIVSNEIKYLPPGWQVNKDESALEIVDRKINPVFQIIKTDDLNMTIYGYFPDGDGQINVCDTDSIKRAVYSAENPELPVLKAKRIFKYPANRNLGKRIEDSN